MSSNSSKKKSSGLRMLWIPGRKNNPKGRLSSTNKHISYSSAQKPNEVWTLGGKRAQSELIDLPSAEINLASTSSLAVLGTMSSTLVKGLKADLLCDNITPNDSIAVRECGTLPKTPIAAIIPNLNSPLSELAPSTPSTAAMPSPILVTAVEHNILNPDDFPKVPIFGETDLSTSAVVLNSSAGTTASIVTNSSPLANRKANSQPAVNNSSPQKSRYGNHSNNQDINSIESSEFDWIDEAVQERNCKELMHKNKRKKSKMTLHSKSSDQLDGFKVNEKNVTKSVTNYEDNDEKVVKCLYYSLMCCDCTIS